MYWMPKLPESELYSWQNFAITTLGKTLQISSSLGSVEKGWGSKADVRETRCLKHTVHLLYHVVMLFGSAMASCCYSQRSGSRAATHSQCHLKDFIIPGYKYKFIWNKWPKESERDSRLQDSTKSTLWAHRTARAALGASRWVNMDRSGLEGEHTPWICILLQGASVYQSEATVLLLSTRKLSVRPSQGNSSLSEDRKTVLPKRLPYVVTGARARGQQHHARSAAFPTALRGKDHSIWNLQIIYKTNGHSFTCHWKCASSGNWQF